ncbi:MAG: rhomboid family intramembrane serine protease [Halobacteriales archaeon]|nr:rhomboid family intramembrane serine protease [Halobacteriales archaeon]
MGTKEVSKAVGYLPITVVGFAVITGWLHASSVGYFPDGYSVADLLHPMAYVGSLFFHADWAHYRGNMLFFLPFGLVLTWLTTNRHVLLVMLVSHLLASVSVVVAFLTLGVAMFGVGSSLAVFGIMGATVVAAAGALRDRRGMSNSVVGYALVLVTVFYFLNVFVHLGHAFGLLFGALVESAYVLSGDEDGMDNVGDEYTPVLERRG